MKEPCKKSFENKIMWNTTDTQNTIISALIKNLLIKPLLLPAAG